MWHLVLCSDHPIVSVMIYDARHAAALADALLDAGIYVIGFSFPVRASCLKPVCCGIDEWCSSVSSCRLLS